VNPKRVLRELRLDLLMNWSKDLKKWGPYNGCTPDSGSKRR
jgi:hypothetical protein